MQELKVRFPPPIDGARYDMPASEVPITALSAASNLVLRHGRIQPRYGFDAFVGGGTGARVIAVKSFGGTIGLGPMGATDNLVVMTTAGWKKYTAGAWVDLAGGLSSALHGTFRVFAKNNAGYLVGINNGADPPQKWDGAAAAISVVGGSPPKARAMMVLANRLLLFNLVTNTGYTGVVSPVGYDVSAFNDFESGWSTTLNGLLIDTPGDIVGALEMGDLQGAIYKSDAVVMATAQSGTVPFHFEWRSIGEVGPCNSRCIMAVQDGSHIYLGMDGAVRRFDGVNVQSLGVHIQKAVLRRADPDLTKLSTLAFGFYDRNRDEAYFIFKISGSGVIEGVVINMTNLSVWPHVWSGVTDLSAGGSIQLPGTTVGTRVVLFNAVAGDELVETDTVWADQGVAYAVTWTPGLSDFGAPDTWKTLKEIHHLFVSNVVDDTHWVGGTQVISTRATGCDDSGNEPVADGSYQTFTLGTADGAAHVTDHRVTRLTLAPEYSVNPVTATFVYRGCVAKAVLRGER